MRHAGTARLETERLILRPLSMDDAETMFQNWANDPEVTRYLRWEPHRSWVFTAELLNEWAKQYAQPDYYQWGICDKATGELFGSICLMPGEDAELWATDPACPGEVWESGYCIGRKWWNKGYTTEALQAVCRYWFETVQGDWLACCHAVENPASGAVMQKVGFAYHHDAIYHKFDGTPVPCRAYRLLRKEFYER